ncbi:MAG: hypothetical protein CMI12_12400 [Oceanospirillum sp.]|nr:hypothetical protein [Oceanospirillum sp.]
MVSNAEKILSFLSPSISQLRNEYEKALALQSATTHHLIKKKNELANVRKKNKLLTNRLELLVSKYKNTKKISLKIKSDYKECLSIAQKNKIKLRSVIESYNSLNKKLHKDQLDYSRAIESKNKELLLSLEENKIIASDLNDILLSYADLKEVEKKLRAESDEKINSLEERLKKVRERYGKIRDNNGLSYFEVIILATMSAGKSTLVNALIGQELLPTSNEACTARIFKIENDDFQEGFIASISDNSKERSWVEAFPESLSQLNKCDDKGLINIKGNIKSIETTDAELVIYDTPGPNNSQDKSHGELTKKILHDGNFGQVIYVMNATQFGVEDDAKLLTSLFGLVEKDLKNKEIIFILNKADQVDGSVGESLDDLVSSSEIYLSRLGFESIKIFPISAMAALLSRKALHNHKLTRKERRTLDDLIDHAEDTSKSLYEYSNISKQEIEYIKECKLMNNDNSDLWGLLDYSGITAVEFFLKRKLGIV